MSINAERLQRTLDGLQADITVLQSLAWALVRAHPNKQKVVDDFQSTVEYHCENAPAETRQELLVEALARLQVHLRALR